MNPDDPVERTGDGAGEPLEASELGRRAVGGAALLAARGTLILALGVVANVVLARLLDPRDFGLVALGTVMIALATHLSEGGLAAALVRRRDDPTRRELEAINALQLGLALPVALAAAAAAVPFGRDGLVVATMVAALPIAALRVPSIVVLERELRYRVVAMVDVVDAVVFYAWSLTTVALGMGVWGMATGVVVRALAGTAAMLALGPIGALRPRWSWEVVRPLLPFGLRFQAANVVTVGRDQAVNVMVAAIAGIAALGVWNLGWRVLQVPSMLFGAIGRVWYPAMSRLVEAGGDPRGALARGAATTTVAAALVLVVIAGIAPSLPALVGPEWDDVSATLLWSALALVLASPVPIVAGYLNAVGAAGIVARTIALAAVVWIACAAPLVVSFGAPGVGLGWIAGAAVSLALFARQVHGHTGSGWLAGTVVPIVIALVAVPAGWAVTDAAGSTLWAGLGGTAAGLVVLLGGLAILRRPLLRATWRLLADAAGRADPPEDRAGPAGSELR